MTGIINTPISVVSGESIPIEIPAGYVWVGVDVPEMTSTSFTVQKLSGNTYKTLRDPIGAVAAAGSDVTFTMGGTSVGIYYIPPSLSAVLDGTFKLVFSSSESVGINLIFRNIA